MARTVPRSALQQLQTLFSGGTAAGWTDGELLERFAGRLTEVSPARAEAAFAALVDRHGPMVWGVCRRTLGNAHDAEDAFQATFLILARRAETVRGETLGRWLYGVARKVALRARRECERRQSIPAVLPARTPADPAREAELGDLQAALEDELGRLRAECRAAVELCHLQGLTQDEAARRLECSARTIKSRLSAGRRRLRARLARRGLAPAAAISAATAAFTREAGAAVPMALARSTVRAAIHSATGGAGAFPASVAALATGAMRAMFLSKLTLAAVFGLAATGAAVHAFQPQGSADSSNVAPPGGQDSGAYQPQTRQPDRPMAEQPTLYRRGYMAEPGAGAPRTQHADVTHKQVQGLAADVQKLLAAGRMAEAQDAVRKLSDVVQGWERSIRADAGPRNRYPDANAQNAANSNLLLRPSPSYGTMPGQYTALAPAAALDSDQERRIRRLEDLIEKLLSERGGPQRALPGETTPPPPRDR